MRTPTQRLENQSSGNGERGQVVTDRGVLIRISSDEAAAWLRHEQRNNPSVKKLNFSITPYGVGVWRETRWPPGYEAASGSAQTHGVRGGG